MRSSRSPRPAARSSSRSWTSRPRKTFERFTERARQVVVLAQDEARGLRHNYIGTEHLLLGVLREEEGLAARTLANLGVTTDEVRSRVAQIVGEGDEEATAGQIPFTPRAKKVLELALRECHTLGHNYIGTEHILLGLVRENEGVGSRVLFDLGADATRVHDAVVGMLGGRAISARETPLPPIARRRPGSQLSLVVVTWTLGALTLGAGILIGWAIWG